MEPRKKGCCARILKYKWHIPDEPSSPGSRRDKRPAHSPRRPLLQTLTQGRSRPSQQRAARICPPTWPRNAATPVAVLPQAPRKQRPPSESVAGGIPATTVAPPPPASAPLPREEAFPALEWRGRSQAAREGGWGGARGGESCYPLVRPQLLDSNHSARSLLTLVKGHSSPSQTLCLPLQDYRKYKYEMRVKTDKGEHNTTVGTYVLMLNLELVSWLPGIQREKGDRS